MATLKKKELLLAEDLFINQGWNAKGIAELLNVQEKTVSAWRQKNAWDKRRAETLAAPHKIRELILKAIKDVADGGKSLIDADALSKLAKVLETMQAQTNPQTVISVLKEFDEWMAEQDAAQAVAFLTWHKLFIQYKIRVSEQ